jgi:hypothetical protein
MFPACCKPLAFALALAAAFASVGAARAGWITVKNDSKTTIVVQEVMTVNGKPVRGKPIKLAAGESFREFQNTPGVKNFEIFDTGTPAMTLWNGKLDCKADMQSFSVTSANGKFTVAPAPEPKKP